MFYLVFTFITKIQQLWFLRPRSTKAGEKLRQGYFLHPHYALLSRIYQTMWNGGELREGSKLIETGIPIFPNRVITLLSNSFSHFSRRPFIRDFKLRETFPRSGVASRFGTASGTQ